MIAPRTPQTLDEAVLDYARSATNAFTTNDALPAILGELTSPPSEPWLAIDQALDDCDWLLLDGEHDLYVPRHVFFANARFLIMPQPTELEEGILIPGHRFLPFLPREGHPADESGLDPQTQAPFLRLLVAEIGEKTDPTGDDLTRLAGHTIAMVDQIRQEIGMVDFWRNAYAQSVLRQWLAQYLDDNDLVPFKRQQALADQFLELAKARHTRLVT